jgi:hypothetical protein
MKLTDAIKTIQKGNGLIRVIDENGEIIKEHEVDGISIDFISAKWLIKIGELESPHYEKT